MLLGPSGNGAKGRNQKNSRRLELSSFKKTRSDGLGKVRDGVDPRFAAGLPFPVPQILEFTAFRDSGKCFQQLSRDFPGIFLGNPRADPRNSHSLLEFSEERAKKAVFARFAGRDAPHLRQPNTPMIQVLFSGLSRCSRPLRRFKSSCKTSLC